MGILYDDFKAEISKLGDSLVVSAENDKVRVHIHSKYPEKVFALCHDAPSHTNTMTSSQ